MPFTAKQEKYLHANDIPHKHDEPTRPPIDESYICPRCNSTNTPWVNESLSKIKCVECGNIEVFTKEADVRCQYCDTPFGSDKALTEHLQMYQGDKDHPKLNSGKYVKTEADIETPETPKPAEVPDPTKSIESTNTLQCIYCDNKYESSPSGAKEYEDHIRDKHVKKESIESLTFDSFVSQQINVLKQKSGKEVGLMYGNPTYGSSTEGLPIYGTLAYAGVSLNNRLYLPEELSKGHEKVVPILVNHSSTAGAEAELHRLSQETVDKLRSGTDIKIGEAKLHWDPDKLTLSYEGVITDEFFKKEVKEANMAVSLGIFYDADSPTICNEKCYTMIKGAEFREMSVVYHPGFPIATILTTEARLLKKSLESLQMQKVSTSEVKITNTETIPVQIAGKEVRLNVYKETVTENTHMSEQDDKIKDKSKDDIVSEPAKEAGSPASNKAADGNYAEAGSTSCPTGQEWDATLRKCVPSDTGDAGSRNNFRNASQQIPKVSGVSPGSENADLRSERQRTIEYYKAKERAEALKSIEKAELRNRAKEALLKERELDAKIKTAKSAAEARIPQLKNPAKELTGESSGKISADESLSKPSAWYASVKRGENVSPSFIWSVNKQDVYENADTRFTKSYDAHENVIYTPLSKDLKKATETIAGPVSTDFMRIMSEQVLVMPSGKVVTPIRQFCDTKILPPGVQDAFFYDFGAVTFGAVTEGSAMSDSSVTIRSAGGNASPRGTMLTINYTQIETSPIDLIAAANRSFALESVSDESIQVVNTAYNLDSGSSGDSTNRKAQGGGSKTGFWVDGNTGAQITTDASGLGKLTFQGLVSAKGVIQDQGLDDTNLITYTTGKAIRDLIFDPSLDSYIGFSRPPIITDATVERIAGTNLVRTSALAGTTQATTGSARSVMFVPNIAFGLVSGRDLTMEAQRRNELQAIYLTGTQRIAGYVKEVEATCRLSHL
jgi:uncharacterized Zn-finger protein